jgi:hypothetical protein
MNNLRIIGVQAKIRTIQLPNTSVESYRQANPLDSTRYILSVQKQITFSKLPANVPPRVLKVQTIKTYHHLGCDVV